MVIKNMGQTCSVCKSLLLHPVKQSIRLNLGVCKMPANDTMRSSCGNLQGLSTASFKYMWTKSSPFPRDVMSNLKRKALGVRGPLLTYRLQQLEMN